MKKFEPQIMKKLRTSSLGKTYLVEWKKKQIDFSSVKSRKKVVVNFVKNVNANIHRREGRKLLKTSNDRGGR